MNQNFNQIMEDVFGNGKDFKNNKGGQSNVYQKMVIGKIKAKNIAGGNITKTINPAPAPKEEKKITGMDLMKGAVKKFFGL